MALRIQNAYLHKINRRLYPEVFTMSTKIFERKQKTERDELQLALNAWKSAMKRFDGACGDEVQYVAYEVEAARKRYMYLLNKRRNCGVISCQDSTV